MTPSTIATLAALCTFLGLCACTWELAGLWRRTRAVGTAELVVVSSLAAALALIGAGLGYMGVTI